MTLEQKRKQLELGRVEMARRELEFKVEERQEEIERLKALIETQKQKESDLKSEIGST